jgi:3'-5' exoribonuclease
MAVEAGVLEICKPVLDDKKFQTWTGSAEQRHHHYGDRMLLQHVCEVADLCRLNASKYIGVDMKVLITAAIYHDIGKVWDYEQVNLPIPLDGDFVIRNGWKGTEHKRRIHHVSRSALFFQEQAIKQNLEQEFVDAVLHCILSHHGQRAWGSPVAPASREAWLLHLCDGISARMDDCEKIDILDKYPDRK